MTPALLHFYIELARFLRGESVQGICDRVERCRGSNFRGTALLARALEAVGMKDEKSANESINEFFSQRRKRKRSKQITDTISMEGTIMLNLAWREGLPVQLNPRFQLYYLSLA